MNSESKLQVVYLDGDAPVQAFGYINGYPFYFHARGRRWRFAVALKNDNRPGGRCSPGLSSCPW